MTEPEHGASADSRPNIVLILADDMGFSDIGCFGSEILTPNLDRLGREGVRFTQMYNCARCCPSRASLLTGLHPHQAGIGHMGGNLGDPAYLGRLSDSSVTIAETLGAAGYSTIMAGKWHIGGDYDALRPETWRVRDEQHPWPLDRGFDHFYGTLEGWSNYFNPHTLTHDDETIQAEGDSYYYTDAISDYAAETIRKSASSPKPFFLYVAYNAPHWPLQALPEDIERYRGRYAKGWDAARTDRHERMIEMGILDSKWPISPRDGQAPPWSDVSAKEWEDARMAFYAAQVDRLDQGIGRILDALREQGLEDNTLVMFMSDNGGCAEFLEENGWLENKMPPTRDGRRIRLGNRKEFVPGPEETFMSYDLPWANLSNAPFRLYKHWVHEGGISTPFVAYWPGAAEPGSTVHQPCHFADIMPTCLDAAGASYPEEFNGNQITPVEGESLVPLFRNESASWRRDEPICWEHEGNRAVRLGEWKLVSKYPNDWELYNMNDDRTELNDQAAKQKALVKEMAGMHESWATRCGVLPREDVLCRIRSLRKKRQREEQ